MNHQLSESDHAFREQFEAGLTPPADFDHRAHVRLAYIYLCEAKPSEAHTRIRRALLAFLRHNGVDASKYHETLTQAWILAVHHFMEQTPESASANDFIARNPRLLDSKIMLSHYTGDVLFSEQARAAFIEPDLEPIPKHSA